MFKVFLEKHFYAGSMLEINTQCLPNNDATMYSSSSYSTEKLHWMFFSFFLWNDSFQSEGLDTPEGSTVILASCFPSCVCENTGPGVDGVPAKRVSHNDVNICLNYISSGHYPSQALIAAIQ